LNVLVRWFGLDGYGTALFGAAPPPVRTTVAVFITQHRLFRTGSPTAPLGVCQIVSGARVVDGRLHATTHRCHFPTLLARVWYSFCGCLPALFTFYLRKVYGFGTPLRCPAGDMLVNWWFVVVRDLVWCCGCVIIIRGVCGSWLFVRAMVILPFPLRVPDFAFTTHCLAQVVFVIRDIHSPLRSSGSGFLPCLWAGGGLPFAVRFFLVL
jgi:hypothetical protein